MKGLVNKIVLVTALMSCGTGAFAIPKLQLGIGDGYYDSLTESISTHSPLFNLYAYGKSISTTDSHFLSIAVTPKIGPDPVPFGSFVFAGNTYDIDDMVYGNPPLEAVLDHDAGDLSPHGIYNTFFLEIPFLFSSSMKTSFVNTQDSPSHTPTIAATGSLFVRSFAVDVSGLVNGYDLHFDLYNDKIRTGGDIDVSNFAPFSHDAQTRVIQPPPPSVPEPAPLALLLSGLLLLAASRRRRSCVTLR